MLCKCLAHWLAKHPYRTRVFKYGDHLGWSYYVVFSGIGVKPVAIQNFVMYRYIDYR